MLEKLFMDVYTKFKIHFYQEIFSKFQTREASLTTVETFALEMISALGNPTINEFATFAKISSPNAAYKVGKLIKKGYLTKTRSKTDKREYHLSVTQKYYDYFNLSYGYVEEVVNRMKDRFTKEETETLERLLGIITDELMPELSNVKGITKK